MITRPLLITLFLCRTISCQRNPNGVFSLPSPCLLHLADSGGWQPSFLQSVLGEQNVVQYSIDQFFVFSPEAEKCKQVLMSVNTVDSKSIGIISSAMELIKRRNTVQCLLVIGPNVMETQLQDLFKIKNVQAFDSFSVLKLYSDKFGGQVFARSFCEPNLILNLGTWFGHKSQLFRELSLDFKCMDVKGVTFQSEPFSLLSKDEQGNIVYGGMEGKTFQVITSHFSFPSSIGPPVTCCLWGGEVSPGNYSGVPGDLQRGFADVVWAGIFLLPPRLEYFDFSESYFPDRACFKAQLPGKLPSVVALSSPLDGITWLLTFITLIISMAIGATSTFLYKDIHAGRIVLYIFAVAFGNSAHEKHFLKSPSFRLLLAFYMLIFLILTTGYKGGLISSLSRPLTQKPMETLADVASSKLPVLSGGVLDDIVLSKKKELVEIEKHYTQFSDYMATLNDASQGKAVLAGSRAQYFYTSESTSLHLVSECISSYRIAFSLRKDSLLTLPFNKVIKELVEHGFINQWYKADLHTIRLKRSISSVNLNQASGQKNALSLTEMEAPFLVLGVLAAASLLVFGGEVMVGFLSNKDNEDFGQQRFYCGAIRLVLL